jgi:hypothetical protein
MERNKGFTYHGFTFADMLFEELGRNTPACEAARHVHGSGTS